VTGGFAGLRVEHLRLVGWQAYRVESYVSWCGHGQEVIPFSAAGRLGPADPGPRRGDMMDVKVGLPLYWYAVGGAIAWAALLFLWWRIGDFERAADLICLLAAGIGWWLGYFIAGFWLLSFVLSCALLVIVALGIGLGWIIDRLRRS
jgi:hypothetical protein